MYATKPFGQLFWQRGRDVRGVPNTTLSRYMYSLTSLRKHFSLDPRSTKASGTTLLGPTVPQFAAADGMGFVLELGPNVKPKQNA